MTLAESFKVTLVLIKLAALSYQECNGCHIIVIGHAGLANSITFEVDFIER